MNSLILITALLGQTEVIYYNDPIVTKRYVETIQPSGDRLYLPVINGYLPELTIIGGERHLNYSCRTPCPSYDRPITYFKKIGRGCEPEPRQVPMPTPRQVQAQTPPPQPQPIQPVIPKESSEPSGMYRPSQFPRSK